MWLWNKVQITLCQHRCSVCGSKAIVTPHHVKCCDAFGECAQWTLRMNSYEVSLFIWSITFHIWRTFHPTVALQFNFQIKATDNPWNTKATTRRTVFVFISCLLNCFFQDTVSTPVISYHNLIQFGKCEISSLNSVKRYFLGRLYSMQWFLLVSTHQSEGTQ